MRLKHNKKRNTAFVYEALVRELTESVVKNNKNKQNKIVKIIKEHFNISSNLKKELELYRSIYETKEVEKPIAPASTPSFIRAFIFLISSSVAGSRLTARSPIT